MDGAKAMRQKIKQVNRTHLNEAKKKTPAEKSGRENSLSWKTTGG